MNIEVRLFAVARERVGSPVVRLELPEPATVGRLREVLLAEYPALVPIAPHLKFAVDADYAADDHPIGLSSEVAVIPPVSGGSS